MVLRSSISLVKGRALTGAWIETFQATPTVTDLGRALTGAWIETGKVDGGCGQPGRRALTGAWIETPTADP